MKRKEALNLIANQLDFLNGKFEVIRANFSEEELKKAEVILTTLEHAGMLPPYRVFKYKHLSGIDAGISLNCTWEPEDPVE